jgi:hypothetical protein
MLSCLALGGCWNGENTHFNFGDISLGQQLIDLKSALDAEAMTQEEYEKARQSLLALSSICASTAEDES